MIIAKSFEFDAGHRLVKGYVGPCSNLHGHRYKVEIELESTALNEYDMVYDFLDLSFVKKWIDDTLDHKLMLYKFDPIVSVLENAEEVNVDSVVLFDNNPTAEYIAKVIFTHILEHTEIPARLLCAVKVWETPKCWAKYHGDYVPEI